jgi:peptide/nickel transport system permease protein
VPLNQITEKINTEKSAENKILQIRKKDKGHGLLNTYWRQFRKHRLGTIGAIIVGIFIMVAIFAPLLVTHDDTQPNWNATLFPPGTPGFLLGTDSLGRDLYSRLIMGTRISLIVAFIASGISAIIGSILGAVSGYMGGITDTILSSIMDLTWSIPTLLVALLVIAIIGAGISSILLSFGLTIWALYARVVRAEVLSLRDREFIIFSRALGSSPTTIIFQHILPNTLPAILVVLTVMVGQALLVESGLSFLGIGIQPPNPSWGSIMSDGHDYFRIAPWLTLFPGLAISLAVLGFNLLGDAIRDVVDPRQKRF